MLTPFFSASDCAAAAARAHLLFAPPDPGLGQGAVRHGAPRLDGDVMQAAVLQRPFAVDCTGRLVLVDHRPRGDELVVHEVQLQLVHHQGLAHGALEELDLPRGVVAHPEVPDLPGRLQRVERCGDLLGLGQGIRAVEEEDVDIVGFQPAQARIDRVQDVFPAEIVAAKPAFHGVVLEP